MRKRTPMPATSGSDLKKLSQACSCCLNDILKKFDAIVAKKKKSWLKMVSRISSRKYRGLRFYVRTLNDGEWLQPSAKVSAIQTDRYLCHGKRTDRPAGVESRADFRFRTYMTAD